MLINLCTSIFLPSGLHENLYWKLSSQVIYKVYCISDFKIEDFAKFVLSCGGTTDIILIMWYLRNTCVSFWTINTMTSSLGDVILDNSSPERCSRWTRYGDLELDNREQSLSSRQPNSESDRTHRLSFYENKIQPCSFWCPCFARHFNLTKTLTSWSLEYRWQSMFLRMSTIMSDSTLVLREMSPASSLLHTPHLLAMTLLSGLHRYLSTRAKDSIRVPEFTAFLQPGGISAFNKVKIIFSLRV